MNILIACEESGIVTQAFRERGHNAWSCDLLPTSGNHPEWHLQMDVFEAIKLTQWDMMIAFPECTHLAVSGAAHFKQKQKDGRQQIAKDFFMKIINAPIEKIAVENPIGIMSTEYRKPDQIIHPYYFGDKVRKSTCLWLKNLPKLKYSLINNLFEIKTSSEPEYVIYNSKKTKSGKSKYSILGTKPTTGNNEENRKFRSKTFPGIAKAMATQWSEYLLTIPAKDQD